MTAPLPEAARRVLDFWFDTPGSAGWNTARRPWFTKSDEYDAEIRRQFLADWQAAHEGATDDWSVTPEGACARVVLLDQFPRNMFRNDPRSFATDAQALALAKRIVATGRDRALPTDHHRMFCYMPFEHSEALEDQDEAVRLMTQLRDASGGKVDVVEWAEKHRVIIARYGRFPHRNAVLGRQSTPQELALLRQPGSSF
ncbi:MULTISPECIES: DUF924 family protein [Cupriavidus]|uniref:DUF924 family protein n=1 Tax=Cupriavidus sp. DF5525 TaxID=3160989 RepID=UPI0003B064F6|nr:membrane protein [Ralstonia pickettii DTP0602]